jgi:hypothetical protein
MLHHSHSIQGREPFAGFSEAECMIWMQENNRSLIKEFMEVAEREKADENFLKTVKQAQFFRHGTFRSPEWQKWWQGIVDQGLGVWKNTSAQTDH